MVKARNISVMLKTINGANLEFSLPSKSTVAHLKTMVAERESIATNLQRIIFAGKELADASTLDSCSVRDKSQLFCVMRVANVQIMVKTIKDRVFLVTAEPTTTVHDIKKNVAGQDPTWEVARQRIIFQGKELADSALITNCGLEESSPTVHVVMRLPAPGTARRSRKEEASTVSKGKKKGDATSVTIKEEVMETEDGQNEFDDFLHSYNPMDLDAQWPAGMDDSSPVNLPPSPQWDDCLKLPNLDSTEDPAEDAGSPPSPSAATATASPASFADMVANVKAEDTEEGEDAEELPMPSTQGRAYDLAKVDDKLRKRLLKNRLSAERSRQRKQAHVETLEFELSCCRSENEHLKKRVASLEAQLAAVNISGQSYAPQRTQIAA